MAFRPGYGVAYPHYPPQPPQIMFGQMRMPGQGQMMPPKMHQMPPQAAQIEPTPVFVGNISEKCTDEFMQKMLEECGKVASWKRIQGTNGKMQGFGFCNFAEPEGTLRALRILNDFHLGDKKLTVKAEEKVRSELRRAAIDNRRREGKKDLKLKDDELPADEEDLKKDEEIRLQILHWIEHDHPELLIVAEDGELSDREAKKEDKKEAERKADHRHKDERNRRRRSRSRSKGRSRRTRSRESPRHKRSRRSRSSSSSSSDSRSSSSGSDSSSRSRTPQRQKFSGSKRRRDRSGTRTSEDSEDARERRIMRQQVKEKEQAYLSRLKRWESREKQRAKQYEREERKEKDRKKETQKEAKRLRHFMEDYDDEKDDVKWYKSSSLFTRKREFEREKEMDQKDRLKEQQEIEELKKQIMAESENGSIDDVDLEAEAKKRHKIKEDEALRKMRADSGSPNPHQPLGQAGNGAEEESSSSDGSGSEDGTEEDGNRVGSAKQDADTPNGGGGGASVTSSDKEKVLVPANGGVGGGASGSGGGWKAIGSDGGVGTSTTINRSLPGKKHEFSSPLMSASSSSGTTQPPIAQRLSGVFGIDDDDEEDSSKKKLKPFEITREERMQVMSAEEKKDLTRGIIKRIPTTKVGLFAVPIEWDYIDKQVMESKIKPWVAKKVQEFLGDEEKQLVDYISERIESRSTPDQLLKDLAVIIDDDADMFVVKLWRLLVFEGQTRKLGVNS